MIPLTPPYTPFPQQHEPAKRYMTSTTEPKPWDLSHVLELIKSLSVDPNTQAPLSGVNGDHHRQDDGILNGDDIEKRDFVDSNPSLGDFSRIYQFLGSPVDSPRQAPVHSTDSGPKALTSVHFWDQYASDGATYIKPGSSGGKVSHWQDFSTAEDTQTDAVSDASIGSESQILTKKERKKLRKKERKEERRQQKTLAARLAASNVASESEAEIGANRTPARKASAHVVTKSDRKVDKENSIPGQGPGTDQRVNLHSNVSAQPPETPTKPSKEDTHGNVSEPTANIQSQSNVDPQREQSPLKTPPRKALAPFRTPVELKLTPASVLPRPATARPNPTQNNRNSRNENITPIKKSRVIEPMIVRSGEDRDWTLLMKLIGDFWDDRKYLIAPMNLTTHNNDPKGIHVFVDASNIFIGFNDQLKRSRGIPPGAQVPQVGLSFDALALLMERRRPVAKRVLVGSTPHLRAFDKAKAVGYECNILEKVYKARELTERQIHFKELDMQMLRKRTKVPPANDVFTLKSPANGGGGNVSETNSPQFAKPQMIEQGVDEILHLKMLESVVDTDEPSTIVLATGDAAFAEYSQGFMAMAQRALKKGWRVELVSWSASISAMYRKREWTEAWGDRFRIIMLDDYAEELLDI